MSTRNEGSYCTKCGVYNNGDIKFCPKCGTKLNQTQETYEESNDTILTELNHNHKKYIRVLSDKEKTAGIIWASIGFIQLILGILILVALIVSESIYGGAFLYCSIWFLFGLVNISAGNRGKKQAKRVLSPYTGMIEEYEKTLKDCLFRIMIHILFGLLFGIIGSIYDLTIRNYVMSNSDIFEEIIDIQEKKRAPKRKAKGIYRLEVCCPETDKKTKDIIYYLDDEPFLHNITENKSNLHYVTAGKHCICLTKGVITEQVIPIIVETDTVFTIDTEKL